MRNPSDKPRVLSCQEDLDECLGSLLRLDRRLVKVARVAPPVRLRKGRASFAGLARIINSQQISTAAAQSIWTRLSATVKPMTAASLAAASDAQLQAAGVSRPKIRTLRAIAEAIGNGQLKIRALRHMEPQEAHNTLTAIKGIGPWTADIYLMFCIGHGDIFPSRDVALQGAVAHALALESRPAVDELDAIAAAWSPWRTTAATVFWAYYGAIGRGRGIDV